MNLEISNPVDLNICKTVILDELNFLKLLLYATNESEVKKDIESEIKVLRSNLVKLQRIKIEFTMYLQTEKVFLN